SALFVAMMPASAAEVDRNTMLDAEQSKPWRGVGRINIAGLDRRGMCTGTLIAPDIVLTAAHCVVNLRTGKQYLTKDINFVAGWFKGGYSAHSKAKAVVLHPGWSTAKPKGIEDLGRDLAVIRLADPVPEKAASSFRTGNAGELGEEVLLLSYRRDRPHALTRQEKCRYLTKQETVVTLACRIVGGTSGAPVFEVTKDGPRIVAVISAKAQVGMARAFAARVEAVVDQLISELPK
ncbi:MAG: trypsin-like peptidase domain-containing protein, partial [Pseudomonadota bacterium]